MRQQGNIQNTSTQFSELIGTRIDRLPEIPEACNALDDLSCADLQSVLLAMSDYRSRSVHPRELITNNKFHKPSDVSPRTLHSLEGVIFDALPEVEFIELSPLQPFGTNTALAEIGQKSVVSSLRNSEVTADITTALFVAAISKLKLGDTEGPVHLAGNSRVVRAQNFGKQSRLLPHFKMFGQVTVGRATNYGPEELDSLSDHMAHEMKILDAIALREDAKIDYLQISVGNTLFAQQLVGEGSMMPEERRVVTKALEESASRDGEELTISAIPILSPDIEEIAKELGITHGFKVVERFRDTVAQRHPQLLGRMSLDLTRILGKGYYRHICYKVNAFDEEGVKFPLVDGGTTDWAKRVTQEKLMLTVTSGIGMEFLAKYLIRNTAS